MEQFNTGADNSAVVHSNMIWALFKAIRYNTGLSEFISHKNGATCMNSLTEIVTLILIGLLVIQLNVCGTGAIIFSSVMAL